MSIFNVATGFIAFVFVIIIAIWVIFGILVNKGCHAIQDKGLKGVAEQAWNGTNIVNNPSTNAIVGSRE